MIIAINYADRHFAKAQQLNLRTALAWGADRTIAYTPADMDASFRRQNEAILAAAKGNGYYLWKPYFLNKAYRELKEGDYLIYTDAGSIYVNKIQYLIHCMERERQELMVFSLQREMLERKYTKRDAFVLMGCDNPRFTDTPQSIGGYVILKKSDFVEKFIAEDLKFAQDERIITERKNTLGFDDYPEFIAHRHDQSVWSLMVKKYDIKRFRDPSQYGLVNHYEPEVERRSTYPQIIDSHRMNVGSLGELRWRRSRVGRLATKVKNKVVWLKKKRDKHEQ